MPVIAIAVAVILFIFYFFSRWRKGKLLLLASLSCWIIFTLPLGFIQPPATRCIVKKNSSSFMLETPIAPRVYKRDVSSATDFVKFDRDTNDFEVPDLSTPVIRRTRGTRPVIKPGRSPTNVEFASNYNEKQHYNLVVPIYSDIVYTIEVSRIRTIRSFKMHSHVQNALSCLSIFHKFVLANVWFYNVILEKIIHVRMVYVCINVTYSRDKLLNIHH